MGSDPRLEPDGSPAGLIEEEHSAPFSLGRGIVVIFLTGCSGGTGCCRGAVGRRLLSSAGAAGGAGCAVGDLKEGGDQEWSNQRISQQTPPRHRSPLRTSIET